MVYGDTSEMNQENLLRLGIRTAKQGNKDGARLIFQQVLEMDRRNERAWLWMASIADNEADRRRYLETVLQVNPRNETARRYLSALDQSLTSTNSQSVTLGVKIVIGLAVLIIVVLVFAMIIG